MDVVPTIKSYYNSFTNAIILMPRRITPNKRDKRSSSDDSDSSLSDSMDEGEVENVSESKTKSQNSPNKRQRRLLINQQKEPFSPDHTYKTSDEEYCSEQERECDMVLETMLPCKGPEELLTSTDDDEDENDKGNGRDGGDGDNGGIIGDGHGDDDDDDDDDANDVVPGIRALTSSGVDRNLEGLVRVKGMSAKSPSCPKTIGRTLRIG